MNPLGAAVGGDDHGSGVGLSGGAAQPNTSNSQAARFAQDEQGGFNAGVGGAHASGGLPAQTLVQDTGSTPIADKFMSGGTTGAGSGKLDNALDNFGGGNSVGTGAGGFSSGGGATGQDAVSGAYEGSGTRDALTGQSKAFETSPGVGFGGENLASTLGSNDTGANAAAGTGHAYGTGVGASGGAGGHYDPETAGSGTATGATAAGAGLGGLGAAGAVGDNNNSGVGNTTGNSNSADNADSEFQRGAPLSDPKELDSGGPHALVFDEATGKYIHRHEREGGALADDASRPE
ncbi:hypothetical protein BD324DRAFT_625884 [Kockovaella imperatae]|uniref:Uncharacterized protein n=1 Tax=Kockovaella imperatae TaxID=4999 RepID=A0A1Y1UH42_9TREE|nr:hypothetical protein BD324DRAFT_625884 [Kockovaella imperatae]ORX37371.1 hypothetical protein BD324DRAFT_625884 [Kockovaella imperatae]